MNVCTRSNNPGELLALDAMMSDHRHAPESNQTCIDGWRALHIATHDRRGLAATGAGNAPIDRLGIARFGAQ